MRIEDELRLYGCDATAQAFDETLQDVFTAMFATWTIEELERRPSHGVSYVEAVRRAMQCRSLEEEMVMRRLQNIRKSGKERRPAA